MMYGVVNVCGIHFARPDQAVGFDLLKRCETIQSEHVVCEVSTRFFTVQFTLTNLAHTVERKKPVDLIVITNHNHKYNLI